MLLFQICIPFAIEHFKLRTTIKSFLHYWFTAVGWALGLTDFLLPRPDDNGGQENANGEPVRQALYAVPVDEIAQQDQPLAVLEAVDDLNGSIHASGNSNITDEYDADDQSDSE